MKGIRTVPFRLERNEKTKPGFPKKHKSGRPPGRRQNRRLARKHGGFLAVEIFRLYGDEGMKMLGEIYNASVAGYFAKFNVKLNKFHCMSVTEWTLIGDPSLRIGGYE